MMMLRRGVLETVCVFKVHLDAMPLWDYGRASGLGGGHVLEDVGLSMEQDECSKWRALILGTDYSMKSLSITKHPLCIESVVLRSNCLTVARCFIFEECRHSSKIRIFLPIYLGMHLNIKRFCQYTDRRALPGLWQLFSPATVKLPKLSSRQEHRINAVAAFEHRDSIA